MRFLIYRPAAQECTRPILLSWVMVYNTCGAKTQAGEPLVRLLRVYLSFVTDSIGNE